VTFDTLLSVMEVPKTLVQYVSFNPGSEHMKSCFFHTKLCSVRLNSDLFCEGFIFNLYYTSPWTGFEFTPLVGVCQRLSIDILTQMHEKILK